jgi:hypothetical protein
MAAMKTTRCKIRLREYEIEEVSAALQGNMIDPHEAWQWLEDLGALGWLQDSSALVAAEKIRDNGAIKKAQQEKFVVEAAE